MTPERHRKLRTLKDWEASVSNVDPARRTLAVPRAVLVVTLVLTLLGALWLAYRVGETMGMQRMMQTTERATASAEYYRKLLEERVATLELAAHLVADEHAAIHGSLVERVPGWPELTTTEDGS